MAFSGHLSYMETYLACLSEYISCILNVSLLFETSNMFPLIKNAYILRMPLKRYIYIFSLFPVALWLAGTCWLNWCFFIIFVQWIIPTSAVPVVRAFMAAVLLTSLVVLKIKTAVIVVRYNRSVLGSGTYSLYTQRLTIRERKVLADTRFTLLTFMVLFIPTAALSIVRPAGIYGSAVFPWTITITLLNSAVNPLIQL